MSYPIPLKKNIFKVFNFDSKVDEKYYYIPRKYKGEIYQLLEEGKYINGVENMSEKSK